MKKLFFIIGLMIITFLMSCGDSPSYKNQFFTKGLLNEIDGYIDDMYQVSYSGDDTLVVDDVKYYIPYMNQIPSGNDLDRVEVFIVLNNKAILLNSEQNKKFALKIERRLWKAKRDIRIRKQRKENYFFRYKKKKKQNEQDQINKILSL